MNLICFDIGNVLFKIDMDEFIAELIASGLFVNKANCISWLREIQPFIDLGYTDMKRSLEKFSFYSENEVKNLVNLWNECLTPNEEMFDLVEHLKKYHDIAFLSNMGFEGISYLRNNYKELFNNVIEHISCEVGARKPDKLFFQSFIMQNKNDHNKRYFIDDLIDNTNTASNIHLNGDKYFNAVCINFDLSKDNVDKQIKLLKRIIRV